MGSQLRGGRWAVGSGQWAVVGWVWWRAVLVQGRSDLGTVLRAPVAVVVGRKEQGAGSEDEPVVFRVFSAL